MTIKPELTKRISEASSITSDPERAKGNLTRFFELHPEILHSSQYLSEAARLFSVSQFLANFCIAHPEDLISAINERRAALTKRLIEERAGVEFPIIKETDIASIMKGLRLFKKRYLLRITLRYLLSETDIKKSKVLKRFNIRV